MAGGHKSFYDTLYPRTLHQEEQQITSRVPNQEPDNPPFVNSCKLFVRMMDVWWGMIGWALAMLVIPLVFFANTFGLPIGPIGWTACALMGVWAAIDLRAHEVPLGTIILGMVLCYISWRLVFFGSLILVIVWTGYWFSVRR